MTVQLLMQQYDDPEFQDDEDVDDFFLKPKTKVGETLQPIRKFKQVARGLSTQKRWTQNMQIKIDDRKKAFKVSSQGGDGRVEILTFNAAAFKSNVQSCGRLSKKAKRLLIKTPWSRTTEELKVVFDVVDKLKGFKRYPPAVKRELAKVVYYECFEDGRIVVQQGHPGLSFYIIVGGAVSVQVAETDQQTGVVTNQTVGEMYAGESFGELSLLHGTKRAATIICKGTAEFLRVDKSDFDGVLHACHQKDWKVRLEHLRGHPVFREWSLTDLIRANNSCKLKEIPHNKVLLKDTGEQTDCVFFIKSGLVRVVKEMTFVSKTLHTQTTKLSLPPVGKNQEVDSAFKLRSNETFRKFFLVVQVLEKGDYFGVGEDMTKTSLITVGKVELIIVPKSALNRRDRGRQLEKIKDEFMEQLPTREQIFESFLVNQRWNTYKRKLMSDLTAKKVGKHCTTFCDVPKLIRDENKHYYDVRPLHLPPIH